MMRRCLGKHQLFPYLTGYCMDQTSDKEQGFYDRLKCLEQSVLELLMLVRGLDLRVEDLSEALFQDAQCQDTLGLEDSMVGSAPEDDDRES